MGVEARAAFYVSRKPTKTYCFHAPAASERSTPNQNMGVEARAALYISRKLTKTYGFHDPTASEQFKPNQNMGAEARAALYAPRKPTKTHGFHDPTASEQFKLSQNMGRRHTQHYERPGKLQKPMVFTIRRLRSTDVFEHIWEHSPFLLQDTYLSNQ